MEYGEGFSVGWLEGILDGMDDGGGLGFIGYEKYNFTETCIKTTVYLQHST